MNGTPVAILPAGVTGSGKTTLAKALVGHGMARVSVDEEVFRAHGRYGVDYPEDGYFEREAAAVELVRDKVIRTLKDGQDVVIDHGLWTRDERRQWRDTVRGAGALPVLVYLPISFNAALARLAERNHREDANALAVTPEALGDFFARFDVPASDEGDTEYAGDPAQLIQQINELRDSV